MRWKYFFSEEYMKKLLIPALCFLFAASFVMAGGQRGAASSNAPVVDRSNFNELGTYPLVKEKVTINAWWANANLVPGASETFDIETNWLTKFYEDKTNVHVNWTGAPNNQFKERLNLALAAGEPIDVVINGGSTVQYSRTDFLRFAEQQLIIPIQNYIETDTIYLKKGLNEIENLREISTAPDGSIYYFPAPQTVGHWSCYGKLWVNTLFLKNVGLNIPTTIDEFRNMLIAFRDRDANGNGDPSDELPFVGAVDSWWTPKVDPFIMSAFIIDDGENRLFLKDGTVTAAYTQPEFREGLRYIRQLYAERLIYPDSFTMDQEARIKLGSTKYESIIGAATNGHHWGFGAREDGEPVRWIDYEPIKPLIGPGGVQTTRYDYYPNNESNAAWLPATCKNLALIARWIDWFYTEEGVIHQHYGGKDISWTDADSGTTGAYGWPAQIKPIVLEPGDAYYNNVTWGNGLPNIQTQEFRNLIAVPEDMYDPKGDGLERLLWVKTRDNYLPYAQSVDTIVPPLWFNAADANTIAMLTTNINTYVEESIAKFITGQLNIETDWDRFQSQLKALGIDQYLKIQQDTYNISPFAKK
jgi:putative aldouronate transport system substrate-binding protein